MSFSGSVKENIWQLLNNIKNHNNIGISSVEAVGYAIEKGLGERTELGNLKLSRKGEDFLSNKLKWDNI